MDGEVPQNIASKADEEGPGSSSSNSTVARTLHSALTDVNLDVNDWTNHLKSCCGVTEYGQIQFLGEPGLRKLDKVVKYDWERNALKKLLGIGEKYDKQYKDRRSKDIEREKEAQQIITDIKALSELGRERTDTLVKNKESQLRDALNIPDNVWEKDTKDLTIDSVVNRFSGQLGKLETLEANRTELSAKELLEKASGGLALKGILITKNLEDCFETRRTVIEAPSLVELKHPISTQKDDVVEFSSKEQSDNFCRSLEMIGYGMSGSVKDGKGLIHAEAGTSMTGQGEIQKETVKQTDETYLSRIMYSYVPTKVCEIQKRDLKFSEDALQELKELARLQAATHDKGAVRAKCDYFLRRYGSHVNAGHIEFGGVYQLKATFDGKTESNKETIQEVVQNALDSHVSISYGIPGIRSYGSAHTDLQQGTSNVTASYTKGDLSRTTLKTEMKGGPQEVNDLPAWKKGLLRYNETWAIIDRGHKLEDFVGVWEIIRSNKKEFPDAGILAQDLQKTWELLSGITNTSLGNIEYTVRSMDEFLGQVLEWDRDDNLSKKAVEYLEKLGKQARQCCSQTGDSKLWVNKMNRKTLSDFLTHVMEIRNQYSPAELCHVKHLLHTLVIDTKEPFNLRTRILHWVSEKQEAKWHYPAIDLDKVNDIPSLITLMKKTFLPRMETVAFREESEDQLTTTDLALAVNHLRQQFSKAVERQYDLFLLMVSLFELNYDTDKLYFEASVTHQGLTEFIERLERNSQVLKQYKSELQVQAHLIELLILSMPKDTKHAKKEFDRFLIPLQKYLCPEISSILWGFDQGSKYQWSGLLDILEGLKKGNKGNLEPKYVDIHPFSEILNSAEQWVPSDNLQRDESPVLEDSTYAGKLLRDLGLTEYYPSKLTLQHVTVIGDKSKGTLLSNLPWRILQKLMMSDYNGRDKELGECIQRDDHSCTSEDEEINLDDILGSITSPEMEELPNTLDIFLLVYACCDLLLKQSLLQKMYSCRLAVPLMFPQNADDSLTFSLWALRSINLKWKDNEQNCFESSIESHPMKCVSFIRFGSPSVSKSSLLNRVISQQQHHTFWNKECPNGNSQYSIADGLVEAQWYLPSGKATDTFKEVTMFLNLRGDANHHKKQMTVVQRTSNITVCCLATEDLENTEVLETMKAVHSLSKVILVISPPDCYDKHRLQQQLNTYLENVGKPKKSNIHIILGFKEAQAKTNEDLGQELRNVVHKFLLDGERNTIIDTSILAKGVGITIDEDDQLCQTAKALADEIRQIIGERTAEECLAEMFPLQGDDWHKWSKLQISKHRTMGRDSEVDIVQEMSDLQEEMTLLRQNQLESCQTLSLITKTLICNLLKVMDSSVVLLYMRWLSFHFNELNRHSSETSGERHGRKSLGLQHIFREFAQMYSAGQESCLKLSLSTSNFMKQLPKIAAKLLLKGQPMELMDGDAENVPLTWVKAVFSALKELAGDKRLFALSVLGIQSSGKSTLLNTMFGQQFPVSAGRCTRGVYMQLIKVDEETTDLPYDYVLLMDTEGLRAPEREQQMYGNDNKFATFSVGLGDVAILNIKGANLTQISDILQITVLAFLKMKLTLKKQNRCVFIHQNVPDINAKEEISHESQVVRETLDRMTAEACSFIHVLDVHSFNDVIEFDSEKSVWYYSDLWQGDPPMAPVNPGYTENVQESKDYLLRDLTQKQETFLTISNMSIRVEDMWKGVLSENFVLGFKNCLAAKAYQSLESKYHEKCWTAESSIAKWVTQTAFVRLEKCTTPEDLESCTSSLCLELEKLSNKLRLDAQADLKFFFETHNLKDILIQWKVQKMENLSHEVRRFNMGAEREIQAKKSSLKVDVLQKTKQGDHNLEIMNKAKHLANDMKDNPLNKNQLQEKFDQVWIEWVKEFSERDTTSQPLHIEQCVERTLFKRFGTYGPSLTEELQNNPLSRFRKVQDLGHISVEDTDLSNKSHWYSKLAETDECKERRLRDFRHKAEKSINTIMREVNEYLQNIQHLDRSFNESDASCVINIVHDRLMNYNKEHKEGFTFKSDLIVLVAVHACRHAVHTFHLMEHAYQQKHGVAMKINKIKRAAWNLFINTVNQSAIEVTAASNLTNHLEDLVWNAVNAEVSRRVTRKMLKFFDFQKRRLLTEILKDLADNDLEPYKWFLLDPKPFSLVWLTSFTNNTIFPGKGSSKASTILNFAEQEITRLSECVRRGIKETSELVGKGSCPNIDTWSKCLCEAIAELPIKQNEILSLLDQDVHDFEHLEKLLIESLQESKERMLKGFRSVTPETIKWEGETPYKQILDRLWGCTAQCPFCGEVCQETDPDHASKNVDHKCIHHRPIGVTGTRWKRDSTLSLMTCNLNVNSENVFNCEACNLICKESGKCLKDVIVDHKHKEYKTYIPKWDIPPSADSEASKYWMWFMATFKHSLAEWWGTKVPDIPDSWSRVTKQKAIDSLSTYNN